jgi:acetyl-CoA carboxylase biotin carboxylase subunit
MITGFDLVAEQIRVAAGLPLSFTQADVQLNGPRDRMPHQRRGTGAQLPAAPGLISRWDVPDRRGIASTRTAIRATRCRRTTTRCSAS